MAEPKTKPTTETLEQFLSRVPDPQRRADCEAVAALMQQSTGQPAVIWGTGVVGFGRYRYKYASGHEGDWPVIGFAPRKNDLTLYIMPGVETYPDLMEKLGKFKHGKSCLYVKKLSDVDMSTLTELIARGVAAMQKQRVD